MPSWLSYTAWDLLLGMVPPTVGWPPTLTSEQQDSLLQTLPQTNLIEAILQLGPPLPT